MKLKLRNKNIIVHIIAIAIILFISLKNINNYNMPVVLNDEFGYWSNAELLLRNNWLDLAKETPYYSMGYSFFLIPILFFCKSYKSAYHLALILNAIFLAIDYCCAFYILKSKRNVSSYSVSDTIFYALESLSAVLLASNLFYVHIAWSEICLITALWLIAALFVSLESEFKTFKLVLICILVVFSYLIHQRSIGVIIAIAICLSWLLLSKKKYGHLLSIVFMAGIAVFLQTAIKGFQNDVLLSGLRSSSLNDYAVSSMVSSRFDRLLNHFVDFLVSLLGKIYITFACSFGMFAVGLKEYICRFTRFVKKQKEDLIISESFFALLIVCMVGLNAIQCIDSSQRKDVIVYTRYMEFVFGPFLLFSIDNFITTIKRNYITLIVCLMGLLGLTLVSYKQILFASDTFNYPCSPLVGGLVRFFNEDYYNACVFLIIGVILFAFICMLVSRIQKKNVALIVICLCFISSNIFLAAKVNEWLTDIQFRFYSRVEPQYKILEFDQFKRPIYFITDDETFPYSSKVKYLQYVLYDRPIQVVHSFGEINYDGKYFLLTNAKVYDVLDRDDVEMINTTAFTNLYEVRGHAREDKVGAIGK